MGLSHTQMSSIFVLFQLSWLSSLIFSFRLGYKGQVEPIHPAGSSETHERHQRNLTSSRKGERERSPRRGRAGPKCLDGRGHPVDFWYAFKFPGNWQYAYMARGVPLHQGAGVLGNGETALDRTLDQLYTGHEHMSYAMWNDEKPRGEKVPAPKAHAKGVLAMGADHGYWLTHSVPKFPLPPGGRTKSSHSSYGAASQPKYGQSFLCISIGKSEVAELKKLFDLDRLVLYEAEDNADIGPDFTSWALQEEDINGSTTSVTVRVHSLAGQPFTAFGKTGEANLELYSELVAPHFQKDFDCETWQNGAGRLASTRHDGLEVDNDMEVDFSSDVAVPESKDHSKWAVSKDGHVLCVGDINRQEGQKSRGGGTTCIQDPHIASQMLKIVHGVEPAHH